MIEGEAGMGRSRLVREATTILKSEGWRVMTGFCRPLREPLPYGPMVDALGKIGPWLPDAALPPTTGALAPLLPGSSRARSQRGSYVPLRLWLIGPGCRLVDPRASSGGEVPCLARRVCGGCGT